MRGLISETAMCFLSAKNPLWRYINEYDSDNIYAIISLDMVSGMYNHMALRETNSCGRNGNQECRVCHALPVQHGVDWLSLFSTHRQMDFVRDPRVVVCNPVFLPLVLHRLWSFRAKTERLQ